MVGSEVAEDMLLMFHVWRGREPTTGPARWCSQHETGGIGNMKFYIHIEGASPSQQ